MSYVALATESFEAVAHFYGVELGFPVVAEWDRPGGRGRRFDLGGGLRLEILDHAREHRRLQLLAPGERMHLVIEVADIEAAHRRLAVEAPLPRTVPWGARLFQIHDPDGVPVTFLQWDQPLL
jgi:catechol 2,3-dioxygenase-like lactoylglutathione lyase family enzyme